MEQLKSKEMGILSKFSLEDRVAVVTGGGAGIGKGIALGFAGAGAHIVICEIVASRGEASTEEIRALGRKALPITLDVTNSEQVKSMVIKTLEEFGRIDILVNNAGGTFGQRVPVLEIPDEMWDSVINQNLKSTFLCSKMVGRVMMDQKGGNIVNIASMAGQISYTGMVAYSAAKAGVFSFTRNLALALAPYNIRVNSIAPGAIDTPGASFLGDAQQRVQKGAIPLGRIGQPEDIALAAIYLASDAASYVTGANINVAGGKYLGLASSLAA